MFGRKNIFISGGCEDIGNDDGQGQLGEVRERGGGRGWRREGEEKTGARGLGRGYGWAWHGMRVGFFRTLMISCFVFVRISCFLPADLYFLSILMDFQTCPHEFEFVPLSCAALYRSESISV
jgi:hypothetical protein